ncbi:MAG: hypothetical protein JWL88_79 [Parcubacteria group bacterium]|nr:hypothetical protein [Parcubacteria group bacterium]
MEWAKRRQFIVWSIFGAVIVALLAIVAIAIFYKTPTCIDQKQNQGETGIDCGGPCSHACVAEEHPAAVRFARAVSPSVDRTDVIAYIDNPNMGAAAHGVKGTVTIYDANHAQLATRNVTFDLTPGGLTPVLVLGVLSSSTPVTQTFFTIDDADVRWIRSTEKPIVPSIQNIAWQDGNAPRVTATLVNPIAKPLTDVHLVATVFDANGTAIAASSTVVPTVPSQGTAQAIFTWNVPFASVPARVEIVPVVSVRAL